MLALLPAFLGVEANTRKEFSSAAACCCYRVLGTISVDRATWTLRLSSLTRTFWSGFLGSMSCLRHQEVSESYMLRLMHVACLARYSSLPRPLPTTVRFLLPQLGWTTQHG